MMDSFHQFANKEYLYLLLIVPLIILLFIISRIIKSRSIKRYGDFGVISQLMPDYSKNRPVVKFILLTTALALIIFGIARPQFGAKLKEVKREGVEIVIALDVSKSMLAQDIKPSRLESAKRAISKMVERMSNDKIGLIVFAGDAYTQIPITTDYASVELFLETINPGIVPKPGTAVGSAIELGMKSFSPDNEKSKVLIIITDGENHEDNAVEAATKASEKGITVFTIGMGLSKGTPIPIAGKNDFMRDKSGSVVVSKLNVAVLQQVAAAGKGIFVQANNSSSALKTVLEEIDNMEKQEMETKVFSEFDEKFQIPIGIALFLLFIEFLILERRNRLLKNFKLFS